MVDMHRKVFKIRGKGDKEREIPIIPVLYEKILVYLQKRTEEFAFDTKDAFFLTDKGAPLYLKFVNDVVKKELAGLEGFEGKVSPHVQTFICNTSFEWRGRTGQHKGGAWTLFAGSNAGIYPQFL